MKKALAKILCLAMLASAAVMPSVASAAEDISSAPSAPVRTVHIVGDEGAAYITPKNYVTVANDKTGWGQALEAMGKERARFVINSVPESTTSTFINGSDDKNYGPQMNNIYAGIKKGDVVLFSFGLNETDANTLKTHLTEFISKVKELGATAYVVTPAKAVEGITSEDYTSLGATVIDLSTVEGLTFADSGNYLTSDGAIAAAKYVAQQLVTADETLTEYIDEDKSVTKNDIDYTVYYLSEDFDHVTDENTGDTLVTITTTERRTDRYGNQIVVNYPTTKAGSVTSLNTHDTGDEYLTLTNATADDCYNYEFQGLCVNGGSDVMKEYAVVEFNFKGRETKNNNTALFKGEIQLSTSSGYNGRVHFQTDVSDTSNSGVSEANKERSTTGTIVSGLRKTAAYNVGDWNNLKIVIDKSGKKYHVFQNDRLIVSDVENMIDAPLNYIIFGNSYSANNEMSFDDFKVYSTNEKKLAQMLSDGVENYMSDVVLKNASEGIGNYRAYPNGQSIADTSVWLYLPANVASTSSVSYGSLQGIGTSGATMTTISTYAENEGPGTAKPYYGIGKISSPVGYAVRGNVTLYIPVTVRVGTTTVDTNSTGLKIPRFLLQSALLDDTLEIGVPSIFGDAWCVAPNGSTNKSLSTEKSNWTETNISSDGYVYSGTTIKNLGDEERTFLFCTAVYGTDGNIVAASMKSKALAVGELKSYEVSLSKQTIKDSNNASCVKIIIIDAATLKPVVNAIVTK